MDTNDDGLTPHERNVRARQAQAARQAKAAEFVHPESCDCYANRVRRSVAYAAEASRWAPRPKALIDFDPFNPYLHIPEGRRP